MTGPERLREQATNVALLVTTAVSHLGEDPLTLLLQTTRRLPRRTVTALARAVGSQGRGGGLSSAYAAWLRGHPDIAAQDLERAVATGPGGPRRRLFAELAVQVGRADLLPEQPGATLSALRARAAWAAGDMTGAVRILEGRARSGLLRRYRSEAEVMTPGRRLAVPDPGSSSWRRAREPVSSGSGNGGSGSGSGESGSGTGRPIAALHVLTNSLPHTQSGYAMRSQAVLAAQAAAGVRVTAATRIGYPVSVGILNARHEDEVDGVRYLRVLPGRMPTTAGARLQRQVDLLAPVAARFAPDVLHTTTNFMNGLVTGALADALGVPWVYEVRGLLEETWVAGRPTTRAQGEAAGSERYRALREKETEVMLSADHVVTLSETLRTELESRGVPGDRITVVPNAVDPALLATDLQPADARQVVGLGRSGFWVGTVSSLVDYEGLDTLIDAISLLRARGVDARGCIVGDGVSRPALEHRALARGVRDHVIFTGRVPRQRAAQYHRALDVFAVPRRDVRVTRFVTPLKPIEAMACGRPVVASDLPALAEIVTGPGSGLLAPAGDAEAWADALQRLAEHPDLADGLGRAGRELAAGRTWERAGTAYRSLYEQLVAG